MPEIVGRCLEKDPAHRYASAKQLQATLGALTDVSPTTRKRRGYLPAERDAFVGRTRELAELDTRLKEGARLLTVLGPGGTGKTRLVSRRSLRSSGAGRGDR